MTVGAVSQTVAFTAVQWTVTRREAVEAEATPGTSAVPSRSDDAATRTSRRSAALFEALDADGDGAVTRDEFTDGALALLLRAGARRRAEREDGHDHHRGHGVHRLERTLGRAFTRADANDDGAIDESELTAALSRADRTGRAGSDAAPEAAVPAGTTTMTLTVVSIAIRRYSAVQDAAPAPTTRPETTAVDAEEPRDTGAAAA